MISLKGGPIKADIKLHLEEEIKEFLGTGRPTPHLAIVQVGDNERSNVYIEQKRKYAHAIGAEATLHKYPEAMLPDELCDAVKLLADNADVHGIIIQMPLPAHFSKEDASRAINSIPPGKDADGLTSANMGRLITGDETAVTPATTRGIMELIKYYKIEVSGKHVVVIGRSNLVGKPTALCLLALGATVTVCHSGTRNLAEMTRMADIIVSATGMPGLVTKDHVRAGQIIIDVGITLNGAGEICGDVASGEVGEVVEALTPVPGGIGPLTVAGLFLNLIGLYKKSL